MESLESRMKRFEGIDDTQALPGVFLVARVDGRSFTRLLRDELGLDRPFDERVRDAMVAAGQRLLTCGVRGVFAFTQSDELSVLLHRDDTAFDRRLRKLNSVLAGEASAAFSLALGVAGAFDCRVLQLPRREDVRDYFLWRAEDGVRNALSAWCYWTLRREGLSRRAVTRQLEGLGRAAKHELLFSRGINFNDVPAWQRGGVALRWAQELREGVDPRSGAVALTSRRVLCVEPEVPSRAALGPFLDARIAEAETADEGP